MRCRLGKYFLFVSLVQLILCFKGQAQAPTIPYCGSGNVGPRAPQSDGKNRPCAPDGQRQYVPRHTGIGFDILDSESKACFVPDQAYRLLDDLIDTILAKVKYDVKSSSLLEQAKTISMAVSTTLIDKGFALYIDTETLGDALVDRNAMAEPPRRIFDCDTGSLIFLTVAENLRALVAMVEMPLPNSKNHHNFVRWLQGEGVLLEWDMNLASQCKAPSGLTGIEGVSLTYDETIGYALSLRPNLWNRQGKYDRALTDFHASMILYEGADVYNNLAWLIATREVSNRDILKDEALTAAQHAVRIWPSANYKDTLACVYALRGEFSTAIKTEEEALAQTYDTEYARHLGLFQMIPPKDCTGQ